MEVNFFTRFLIRLYYWFLKNKIDCISVGILFTIISVFLVPSFLRNDLTGDFIGQEVAWYHFTYINLKDGIIPFWSPYAFSGIPHLLKPELAIAHPFTILTFILRFLFNSSESIGITGQIIELVSVLSFCIGATGIYILSRKILSLSPIAAVFASIAYTLNPFTLFQIHSTSVLHGVTLLPWLVFFLMRFLYKPTFASFLLIVLCNYLLLIGYSYHYVYFFFMQFGLVVFYGVKKILLFFLSFVSSLLLSSFFLLSYLNIYSQSPRNNNNYDIYFHSFASMSPFKIFEIINPISLNISINPSDLPMIFGGPTLTWGTFAFIFLIYGIFSLRSRPFYLWIFGVLFVSLFYSFGGNLQSHSFFGDLIPIIYKFRFHARAFICAIFAGSLLIALGVQTIKDQKRIKYIELFFWTFFLLIFVGLILGQLYFLDRINNNLEIYKGTTITLLFLFTSLIITALTIKYGKKTFLVIGLLIMLIEYHLFFQNYTYFFTKKISYDQFYKLNSLIPEVPTNSNLFRMYFEDNQFAYNTSVFKIFNMYGYENSPHYSFGERLNKYGIFRFYQISNLKYFVTTTENWQVGNPDVVRIKSINPQAYHNETFFHGADKVHYIYRIDNYLPRFYVPARVEQCNDSNCWIKDDPPKLALAKGISENINNPKTKVDIKVEEYKSSSIKLKVKTPHKTFVSSSEAYDKGWNIRINNKTSTIYNTSNGVRGFIVPSGTSIVEMYYFPPYLLLGSIFSIIGVFLLVLIWKFRLVEKYDKGFGKNKKVPLFLLNIVFRNYN